MDLARKFGALHEGYEVAFVPEVAFVRQGNRVCFFSGGRELTESVNPSEDVVVETVDELELVEKDGGGKHVKDGKWVVEGPFQRSDVENANKRRYPRVIWERIFGNPKSKQQETIRARGMIGHLEHPKDGRSDGNLGAMVVTEATLRKDGVVWGKAELLDTPPGLILQEYVRKHVRWGVSSRGNGSVDSTGKVNENDYDLETFDAVMRPSTPGAYPTPTKGVPSTREGVAEDEDEEDVDEAVSVGQEINSPDGDTWKVGPRVSSDSLGPDVRHVSDAKGVVHYVANKTKDRLNNKEQWSLEKLTAGGRRKMPRLYDPDKDVLHHVKRVSENADEPEREVTEAWDAAGVTNLASSGYGTGSTAHFFVRAKRKKGGKVAVNLHVLGEKKPEFVGTPEEAAAHINKHLSTVANKPAPKYHGDSVDTVSQFNESDATECVEHVETLLATPYKALSEDAQARLIGSLLKRFGQVSAHAASGALSKDKATDLQASLNDRMMAIYRATGTRKPITSAVNEAVEGGKPAAAKDEALARLVKSLQERASESRNQAARLQTELEAEQARRETAEEALAGSRKLEGAAVERLAEVSEKLSDAEDRLEVANNFIAESSHDEADSPVAAAVRQAISETPQLKRFRYVLERAGSVDEVRKIVIDLSEVATANTGANGTAALSDRSTLPNRLVVESERIGSSKRSQDVATGAPVQGAVSAAKALKLMGTRAAGNKRP